VPGGAAVLSSAFPAAHDHGKLSVVADVDGALLAAAAEDVLGAAGLTHRLIEVRTPGAVLAARGLLAAGWAQEDLAVMQWAGPTAAPRAADAVSVLTLEQRVGAAVDGWRDTLPDADPDVWRQLGERARTVLPAARTTFLGVLGPDGRVLARADLYEHGGLAQVEEVVTDPASRRQGLASLLVLDAVRRATTPTVFLVADADASPRSLYARLGFRDVGLHASFRRT
jgi:ribosomal protein S18 acetylase RimI-like enzyme